MREVRMPAPFLSRNSYKLGQSYYQNSQRKSKNISRELNFNSYLGIFSNGRSFPENIDKKARFQKSLILTSPPYLSANDTYNTHYSKNFIYDYNLEFVRQIIFRKKRKFSFLYLYISLPLSADFLTPGRRR